MQYLPPTDKGRVSRVCKATRDLILTPTAWNTEVELTNSQAMDEKVATRLLSIRPLTSLSIESSSETSLARIPPWCCGNPALDRYIDNDLDGGRTALFITFGPTWCLASSKFTLRSLSIKNANRGYDTLVNRLGELFPNLESVSLSITQIVPPTLCTGLTKLHTLKIAEYKMMMSYRPLEHSAVAPTRFSSAYARAQLDQASFRSQSLGSLLTIIEEHKSTLRSLSFQMHGDWSENKHLTTALSQLQLSHLELTLGGGNFTLDTFLEAILSSGTAMIRDSALPVPVAPLVSTLRSLRSMYYGRADLVPTLSKFTALSDISYPLSTRDNCTNLLKLLTACPTIRHINASLNVVNDTTAGPWLTKTEAINFFSKDLLDYSLSFEEIEVESRDVIRDIALARDKREHVQVVGGTAGYKDYRLVVL